MATKTSDEDDLTWDDLDEVFGAGDLADVFGCHKNTVYSLCREGVLPYFRAGGSILFKKTIVEAWMASESIEDFYRAESIRKAKETLDKYLD